MSSKKLRPRLRNRGEKELPDPMLLDSPRSVALSNIRILQFSSRFYQ